MTRRLAFALLAAFALAAAVPLACAAPASVKYSAAAKLDQGAQVELSAEEALWQPYAEPASTIEAPQAAEAEGAGRRLLGAPLRFRMANDRVRVNRNPDWMLHHDKMPKQHGKGRGMQGHTNHNTGRPEEDGDMRRRLLSAQGAQEIESAQALLALDAAKAMLAAEREDAAKALLSAEREDAAKAALSAEREDAAKAALATEETKWVPYEEPASAKGLARRLLAQRGSDIAHRFRGRTHEKATGFRGHGPFKRGGGM